MAAVVVGENMAKLWGVVLILCGVISALHDSEGMVQAWVDQKTCKRDILRVFTMSPFENI